MPIMPPRDLNQSKSIFLGILGLNQAMVSDQKSCQKERPAVVVNFNGYTHISGKITVAENRDENRPTEEHAQTGETHEDN